MQLTQAEATWALVRRVDFCVSDLLAGPAIDDSSAERGYGGPPDSSCGEPSPNAGGGAALASPYRGGAIWAGRGSLIEDCGCDSAGPGTWALELGTPSTAVVTAVEDADGYPTAGLGFPAVTAGSSAGGEPDID